MDDMDPIESVITGTTKSGFIIYDGLVERIRARKNAGNLPIVSSRPSKRANWLLEPIARRESGEIAYLLFNTSSAITHNVEVHSDESSWVFPSWVILTGLVK